MMTTTPPTTAPAKPDALATFNRITRDAATVGEALERAQAVGHLVSPATSTGTLPEGTSIALSAVLVDVVKETYPIPGGDLRGLGKVALDRIALAAGVSWDPRASHRLDDGRDPRFCAYLAVGSVRMFDGSTCTITGEKELDMRDGSPAVEALRARYQDKLADWKRDKQGLAPKSPEAQISEVRVHLLSHAASKAKLRAVRSLGIRTSYTKTELAKPFVVAKLTFTGETSDPELRREFALMRAASFLGAHESLYGAGPPAAPQLPPGRRAPPVGTVVDEDGVIETADVDEPAPAPPTPPATTAPVAEPDASQTPPGAAVAPVQETRAAARAAASGFCIPGGRSKGTPLEKADDRDLSYWAERLEQEIADGTGKPQFRDRNEALARAIRGEQGRRSGADQDDGGSSGDEYAGAPSGEPDDDIPFASSAMRLDVHPRAARWERW